MIQNKQVRGVKETIEGQQRDNKTERDLGSSNF